MGTSSAPQAYESSTAKRMLVMFTVDAHRLGEGPIKYEWDPTGAYLAATGSSRVVHIFNRRGKLVDQAVPPSASLCTHLSWSEKGEMLAVAQANSSLLLLWSTTLLGTHRQVDLPCKDISLLQFSKSPRSQYIAIGTAKGHVYIYDISTQDQVLATGKHKRRITCGDWNFENKFAFGSDDRQITICDVNGKTCDQVKIKASPRHVTFGGKSEEKDSVLSVNMGGKTILLYDLNERENALELAFQSRYGTIVSYQWFGDGYIIAGFSNGFVVIISTHLHEIGQEQYCAKFHDLSLTELMYNEASGAVATCGDKCLKVVRMSDWKEIAVEYLDNEETGERADGFEGLRWTTDGKVVTLSSSAGMLYNYVVASNTLGSALFDEDSPLMAMLQPIAPGAMVATMGMVVAGGLLVMSRHFDVPVVDLVRAMSGFIEIV